MKGEGGTQKGDVQSRDRWEGGDGGNWQRIMVINGHDLSESYFINNIFNF